ncbi:MAG: cell division ATP-binding protein FtsE [Myxococcales bacterium]|nr:cell division ATP-binding protein FtsE [Myxococcales bacterium]
MIRLFHVTKRYTRDDIALDDVSLQLAKGDFVFLTGPSGAGKSTLLKLLFAAERPTEGRILVAGHDLSRLRTSSVPLLRRNLGVVFQDFKLLPRRSVFDNVALALDVRGCPRREVHRRVTAILRRVGLGQKMSALPLRLSGGEQQRVAIARALVDEPQVLLADEPTGNLDPELSIEIMNLMATANARGTTVMVATHDPGLLRAYGKRCVRLEQGRVVEDTG